LVQPCNQLAFPIASELPRDQPVLKPCPQNYDPFSD
jgi:hypothetical protein